MEGHCRLLMERIRLGNHDLGQLPKYLDYFQTDNDFYTKIGNKLDAFLRVSYYLTNFLISTPPKYVAPPGCGPANGVIKKEVEEELPDFDAPEEQRRQAYAFHEEDYTIAGLDLPVSIESEFDFNLIFFQAFLSYLKPANYFIHPHELVPFNRSETLKESVTRVLANLVQLLTFVRNFREGDVQDLKNVALCLFDGFEDFFTVQNDTETNGSAKSQTTASMENGTSTDCDDSELKTSASSSYAFFEDYPQEAALLSLVLIAYDKPPADSTYEDLLDTVEFQLNVFKDFPNFENYNKHLKSYDGVLKRCMNISKNTDEFKFNLKESFKINDFKSKLFKVSRTLTNKLLKEISHLDEWDLKDSYLSTNYQAKMDEMKYNYENIISNLRSEIGKEVENENLQFVSELQEKLQSFENENKLLKEELNLKDDDLEVTKLQLEKQTNNADISSNELTYQEFETSNPKFYQNLKLSISKLFASKYYGQISELEDEVTRLKSKITGLEEEKHAQDLRNGSSHEENNRSHDTLGNSPPHDQEMDGSYYGGSIYEEDNQPSLNYNTALVPHRSHQESPHLISPQMQYSPQMQQQLVQQPQQSIAVPPMHQIQNQAPRPVAAPPGVGASGPGPGPWISGTAPVQPIKQREYRTDGEGYAQQPQQSNYGSRGGSYFQPQEQRYRSSSYHYRGSSFNSRYR